MKKFSKYFFVVAMVFLASFSIFSDRSMALTGKINLSNQNITNVYFFGREGCGFCQKEEVFFKKLLQKKNTFKVIYLDVKEPEAKEKFNQITELYKIQKATPITIVGESIIQGFNSEETTGKLIQSVIKKQEKKSTIQFNDYLSKKRTITSQKESVCGDGEETSCFISVEQDHELKIPFFGVINLKDFSLGSLSVILGFVDGFNPCAMWVLLTFLLVLWQVGNRKKMFQVAGLFILAETVMYWLILNFWFSTWDFVGLDKIVTPIVGGIAIVGGIYFLWRYFKDRKNLTCDVTSYQHKSKTEQKIKNLITSPLTILTALGIIGVAFSVNIIEFSCSIGIPQAFTKILEINHLNSFSQQIYILIYTFFYMIDDFVVFGLALYGFDKFYKVGQKYSNLSSFIGGILMLILGAFLLFDPSVLVF